MPLRRRVFLLWVFSPLLHAAQQCFMKCLAALLDPVDAQALLTPNAISHPLLVLSKPRSFAVLSAVKDFAPSCLRSKHAGLPVGFRRMPHLALGTTAVKVRHEQPGVARRRTPFPCFECDLHRMCGHCYLLGALVLRPDSF